MLAEWLQTNNLRKGKMKARSEKKVHKQDPMKGNVAGKREKNFLSSSKRIFFLAHFFLLSPPVSQEMRREKASREDRDTRALAAEYLAHTQKNFLYPFGSRNLIYPTLSLLSFSSVIQI